MVHTVLGHPIKKYFRATVLRLQINSGCIDGRILVAPSFVEQGT